MTDATDIQLDRAEFEQPQATVCAVCHSALHDHYYAVNGETVCAGCAEQMRASLDRGTRISRVSRALGAGIAAALGGAIVYWAILALTGYEFGLIAVVVGIAVGKSVSWGSRGKGGWRYQGMAMVLTYLAMVSAYVPLLITEFRKLPEPQSQAASIGSLNAAESSNAAAAPTATEPTLLGFVMAVALFVALACALPFLSGIQNILGILILGFGLYEAWKLNRPVTVAITGPHTLSHVQPA